MWDKIEISTLKEIKLMPYNEEGRKRNNNTCSYTSGAICSFTLDDEINGDSVY